MTTPALPARVLLLFALALAPLPTGCKDALSPGTTTYVIESKTNASGILGVTYSLKTTAIDEHSGDSFDVIIAIFGIADEQWRIGVNNQVVDVELVAPKGKPFEEDRLVIASQGRNAARTEKVEPQDVTIPWGGTPQTGPGFLTAISASPLRSMVGATHSDFTVGTVRFRLDDAEIRGVAEMLRMLDAAATPK